MVFIFMDVLDYQRNATKQAIIIASFNRILSIYPRIFDNKSHASYVTRATQLKRKKKTISYLISHKYFHNRTQHFCLGQIRKGKKLRCLFLCHFSSSLYLDAGYIRTVYRVKIELIFMRLSNPHIKYDNLTIAPDVFRKIVCSRKAMRKKLMCTFLFLRVPRSIAKHKTYRKINCKFVFFVFLSTSNINDRTRG